MCGPTTRMSKSIHRSGEQSHLSANQLETLGYGVREIQKSAAHAWMITAEEYLNQYRNRLSDVHMPLPPRTT